MQPRILEFEATEAQRQETDKRLRAQGTVLDVLDEFGVRLRFLACVLKLCQAMFSYVYIKIYIYIYIYIYMYEYIYVGISIQICLLIFTGK